MRAERFGAAAVSPKRPGAICTIQQKSAEQLESTERTECAERLGEGKESMKWAKSVDCVTRTESSKPFGSYRIESPVPPSIIVNMYLYLYFN